MSGEQKAVHLLSARLPSMWIGVLWIILAAVQIISFHRVLGIIIIALVFFFLAVSSAASLIIATIMDGAVP
jgi:hypothetical protein